MKKNAEASSWIDAIYSAFNIVSTPRRRHLIDVRYFTKAPPTTVGHVMLANSSEVLSNFGSAFNKVVRTGLNEQRKASRG